MKIQIYKPLRAEKPRSKEAMREQSRKWYHSHKELERERNKKYVEDNRDVINLKQKERYRKRRLQNECEK